jgi:hypothetical protein
MAAPNRQVQTLLTYYRLYNERQFDRLGEVLADQVASYRPEMPNLRSLEPITLAQDAFIRQLASCRDIFGTISLCEEVSHGTMVSALVAFGAGYTGANTAIFGPDGRIAASYVYRRDARHRAREAELDLRESRRGVAGGLSASRP